MQTARVEFLQPRQNQLTIRILLGDQEHQQLPIRPVAEVLRQLDAIERDYRGPAPNHDRIGTELHALLVSEGRWLQDLNKSGLTLLLDTRQLAEKRSDDLAQRLRSLPWELLADVNGPLCPGAVRPLLPVRLVDDRTPATDIQSRPLQILFMAAAPENTSELNYEAEEVAIQQAVGTLPLILEVEESGSLDIECGLPARLSWCGGAGSFDVLHLSGHATIDDEKGPVFALEDLQGQLAMATPDDLFKALNYQWPSLLFLSGCRTGEAPLTEVGAVASFAERCIKAGGLAVLGWAQPVRDDEAIRAANELYQRLAMGMALDQAIAKTRTVMYTHNDAGHWSLLRLYAASSNVLTPLVDVPRQQQKLHSRLVEASAEFLGNSKTSVCNREAFVGRRRILQRGLRSLRGVGDGDEHVGVLLRGMGGLGKSSTAARLLDRLPDHQRIVVRGRIDETALLKAIKDKLADPELNQLLDDGQRTLTQRLRLLFQQTPQQTRNKPLLLVLDDFEQSSQGPLHEPQFNASGQLKLQPEAADVLAAVQQALCEADGRSRLIVTCRYALAGCEALRDEELPALNANELRKKLFALPHLNPWIDGLSDAEREIRQKAIAAGANNPRLLEWLNEALGAKGIDSKAALQAIENKPQEFRENLLLGWLLGQLSARARELVDLLNLVKIPIELPALAALADTDDHEFLLAGLKSATGLGLVEVVQHTDMEYYLADALRPLLADNEGSDACGRLAHYWYACQQNGTRDFDEVTRVELMRLARVANEDTIIVDVSNLIISAWIYRSRWREAFTLTKELLKKHKDWRLYHGLARAAYKLGYTDVAITAYDSALALVPTQRNKVIDKEFGAILCNLAVLYSRRGDVSQAMQLLNQAFDIQKRTDNDEDHAVTLYEMGRVYAQKGYIDEAMQIWRQSLDINKRVGSIDVKAITLHAMARVHEQQGDLDLAMQLWQQVLDIEESADLVQGQGATLHEIGRVYAQKGDIEQAMQVWKQSINIKISLGDKRGRAATLIMMAEYVDDTIVANEYCTQAINMLSSINAWPDCFQAIAISTDFCSGATKKSTQAQGLLMASCIVVKVETLLLLAMDLFQNSAADASLRPLLAAFTLFKLKQTSNQYPQYGEMQKVCMIMLFEVFPGQPDDGEALHQWLIAEKLYEPMNFLSRLRAELIALVPKDGWLFDRDKLTID